MDDPKPPFFLITLIAVATVMGIGAVLVSQNDRDEREMTAAISASANDLSNVLKLKNSMSAAPAPQASDVGAPVQSEQ